MGESSNIEWTDHTFNPWIGCTKVSAGCTHCYAEALVRRYRWTEWGPRGVRKRTSEANWRKPLTWHRRLNGTGRRERVFCASLADVFDERAPEQARVDLWNLVRLCDRLDWQLLTKRPHNIAAMLPPDWGDGWPHVWLGTTTEDQRAFDERWPILAATPAAVRFVSYEPAIGPLTMTEHHRVPDWLIWGGESGPGARPMKPWWAREVTAECEARGVAVFGKQWGSWPSNPLVAEQRMPRERAELLDPKANGKGGALLDGRLWREFPRAA